MAFLLAPFAWVGYGVSSTALYLVGFGSTGVVAGSVAAWIQATLFGASVAAGSPFAWAQAAAMAGASTWITVPVGIMTSWTGFGWAKAVAEQERQRQLRQQQYEEQKEIALIVTLLLILLCTLLLIIRSRR
mmetsp:Transcript_2483/g.5139  ORF Transcript_2483/g.5139 Transcript_2483/m.5139 type:complete len:131 (+) Transcript_2483:174-566(+)|eukprot:CAMPEP_0118933372 /NCGR_PEP_ID=MMETSP1169-20130426/11955_1 /TAXON_ID=36882 /ORGANISM="Pyramimonas obovata, Strain CCMP722" /LENGTH=130 /DNA_ID=CAMNT_0006876127 /DNA_START=122 /DNA_END=514 /DNA_ORIENTATION=+